MVVSKVSINSLITHACYIIEDKARITNSKIREKIEYLKTFSFFMSYIIIVKIFKRCKFFTYLQVNQALVFTEFSIGC